MPEAIKIERKTDLIGKFINVWLKFANENPELNVGDWLYASSLMSGMALRLGGATVEEMQSAATKMPVAVQEIYKNAQQYFPDVPVH
jgi:alpha-D-ribose 1-methylphosphonate 5-triphosphate synthase subunit PhnH